jgi:DNA-binding ferritin-like protein (Dps family)
MKKNIIDTMRLIEALKNKELIGAAETGEGAPLEIGAIEYQRITRTALEDLDALYYEGNYKTDHIGDEIKRLIKLKEGFKNEVKPVKDIISKDSDAPAHNNILFKTLLGSLKELKEVKESETETHLTGTDIAIACDKADKELDEFYKDERNIDDEIEQLTKLKERLKNIDYRKKLINDHEIMLGKMRAEQKQ